MAYELPRTESGEVDFNGLATEFHLEMTRRENAKVAIAALKIAFEAIDANARAEERERINAMADKVTRGLTNKPGSDYLGAHALRTAIRNMEDKT